MSQWIKLFCAALAGAAVAVFLMARPGSSAMAQERPAAAAPQAGSVSIDERDLKWVYVNAYRVHTTAEELILDVGVNMPDPTNAAAKAPAPQTLFRVTDRLVMSYVSARRLNKSLTQVLQ